MSLPQIVKDHVNSDGSGSHASYSIGMWTCLAAMILLLIGIILVFFTCCTERRKKSKGYADGTHEKRSHRRSKRSSGTNNNYAQDSYATDGQANGRRAF